jgi:hypothetical protein
LLGEAAAVLGAAAALDLDALGDEEVRAALGALEGLRARVEAVTAGVVGCFDARRLFEADGARNTTGWLRTGLRVERARAARLVRSARGLRGLPATWCAYAAGEITPEVVARIVRAGNPRCIEALRRDETVVLSWARSERFDVFCRLLDAWCLEHDPDGGYRCRPESRRVHLSQTLGGCWVLDGFFDPVNGAVLSQGLWLIEQELFEADWAEARARLGRDPEGHELGRTPAQRRADAMVEMARRAHSAPPGARRPQPLVVIAVGEDRFARMCETLDGTVLSDEEAAALLDDAVIERITFDGADRPIAVSRQRFFRDALRRAIRLRDRECTHPFCDAPAWACDIDHIQPHATGGPTSETNGRLRCPFHNRGPQNRPRTHRTDRPPGPDP